MTKRRRRIILVVAIAIAVAVAIRVAAQLDMDRERRARRYLGDRLFTRVIGRGDPVVFLAGLQGSTRYWGNAFDSLASSHQLIFVDALGFGRSPWPSDSHYTLDDQIAALRRTLGALRATRNVTIVAHSFGTVVAAYYAARYPDDIRRLVLLGTPVISSEVDGRQRIRQISPLAAAFTLNRPLAIASCTTMCAFRPLLKRLLPKLRRDLPAAVVSDSVLHDLAAIEGSVYDVLLRHPIAVPVATLGPKTIFIHGRRDSVTPLPEVLALARSSGARGIATDGDHQHYVIESRSVITEAIQQ